MGSAAGRSEDLAVGCGEGQEAFGKQNRNERVPSGLNTSPSEAISYQQPLPTPRLCQAPGRGAGG